MVADQLVDGTRFRILTVVDVLTRAALCTVLGHRPRGDDLVAGCHRLVATRAAPARVFVDTDSGFVGHLLDLWTDHHGVAIDFTRQGKPTLASPARSATTTSRAARTRRGTW